MDEDPAIGAIVLTGSEKVIWYQVNSKSQIFIIISLAGTETPIIVEVQFISSELR